MASQARLLLRLPVQRPHCLQRAGTAGRHAGGQQVEGRVDDVEQHLGRRPPGEEFDVVDVIVGPVLGVAGQVAAEQDAPLGQADGVVAERLLDPLAQSRLQGGGHIVPQCLPRALARREGSPDVRHPANGRGHRWSHAHQLGSRGL